MKIDCVIVSVECGDYGDGEECGGCSCHLAAPCGHCTEHVRYGAVVDEDDHDEHPATLAVDPDITSVDLAVLIIEQPMVDVWRGLVAATNPTRAALLWDFAMLAADDLTTPVAA